MKNSLLILFLFQITTTTFAQERLTNVLNYEVKNVYAPLSMSKEKLNKAETLSDLNHLYRPAWIREYLSVETIVTYNGQTKKVNSKNDTISSEQKELMKMADVDTDIRINVKYMPENTLKHNDIQELDFSFKVNPEKGAKFAEGEQQMMEYLKENALAKISDDVFIGYDLAAIKFTIDEEGQVVSPHILWTSKNKKVDQILLKTISKMPCWIPAEYSDGTKTKQEFAFTVGNPENCMANLLNTNDD